MLLPVRVRFLLARAGRALRNGVAAERRDSPTVPGRGRGVTTGNPDGKMLLTPMSSSGSGVGSVVGRQDELADLEQFLAAGDGLPAALVLEGEAGIGKTTLWRSAVAAAADSYRVLSAQPVAAEAELSHAALADLLELCVADVLPDLPRPQQRALEGALLLAEPVDAPTPTARGCGRVPRRPPSTRPRPARARRARRRPLAGHLVACGARVRVPPTPERGGGRPRLRACGCRGALTRLRAHVRGRPSATNPSRRTRRARRADPAPRTPRPHADTADAAPGRRRVGWEPVLRTRARTGARSPCSAGRTRASRFPFQPR